MRTLAWVYQTKTTKDPLLMGQRATLLTPSLPPITHTLFPLWVWGQPGGQDSLLPIEMAIPSQFHQRTNFLSLVLRSPFE